MSNWTTVSGVIEVDTYAGTTHKARYITECVINHLPRISGSEGDVDIFINQPSNYNLSSSCDELCAETNLMEKDYYGFRQHKVQTKTIITVQGHLRDTYSNEIYRQVVKWLTRLSKRLHVCSVHLYVADYYKDYRLDNPQWVIDMPEDDWFSDYESGLLIRTNICCGNKDRAKQELLEMFNDYIFNKEE